MKLGSLTIDPDSTNHLSPIRDMKLTLVLVLIVGAWSRSAIRQAAKESDYMPNGNPNSGKYGGDQVIITKSDEFGILSSTVSMMNRKTSHYSLIR